MNIAKVDATVSTNLASRFGIRVRVRAHSVSSDHASSLAIYPPCPAHLFMFASVAPPPFFVAVAFIILHILSGEASFSRPIRRVSLPYCYSRTCSLNYLQAFPMLKFFHQGSLYDYRGPRDAEHLMEFARVGCCVYNLLPSLYPLP